METTFDNFLTLSEVTAAVALAEGYGTAGMELILLNDDEGNLTGAIEVHEDGNLCKIETSDIMNAVGLSQHKDIQSNGVGTVTVRLENGFVVLGIDVLVRTHES